MAEKMVVVGASGAGLFAAWRLAAAGQPVVVYEQRTGPHWAPRTLIVTDELRRRWPGFAESLLRHAVTAFELRAGSARLVLPLRQPDWVVERSELWGELARLAQGAGAQIRWGWRFLGEEDGSLVFAGRGGEVHRQPASVVFAADGVQSRVARKFGLPLPPRIYVLQAKVAWPHWVPFDRAVVWFDPESTPYFYWLIPDPPGRGALGLIVDPGQPARGLLDRFLATLQLEPLEYQGGVVAAYRPGLPFAVRRDRYRLFCVGDAGGQVKVTTVGGTVTGLWGAAAAVANLHGRGNGEGRRLQGELLAHWVVRRILHRFTVEDYERLLGGLNREARGVVEAVPRDRLRTGAWRLLAAQPRLVVWALRGLLRG